MPLAIMPVGPTSIAIVARLYTIILRVKVSGIKRESFDLEVPIQVVHTAPDGVSSEAVQYLGATTGPVGEDPSLLEFRRASATSWFSNESLVSRPFSKLNSPLKEHHRKMKSLRHVIIHRHH